MDVGERRNGEATALEHYQTFKWDVEAGLDLNFRLPVAERIDWLA